MRPTDTALSHARAPRGFNLVEAAIVLGVVGLVIGGIWSAASAIRTNYLVNQTYNGIMTAYSLTAPVLTTTVYSDPSWDSASTTSIQTLLDNILRGKLDGFGAGNGTHYSGATAPNSPLGNNSVIILRRIPGSLISTMGMPWLTLIEVTRASQAVCLQVLSKFRAAILSDSGGNRLAAVSTANASTHGFLGYFLPSRYSTNADGSPRFDSETTMCPAGGAHLQVYFVPPVN